MGEQSKFALPTGLMALVLDGLDHRRGVQQSVPRSVNMSGADPGQTPAEWAF